MDNINPYEPPKQPVQPAFRLLILKRWSLALYLLLLGALGIGYAIVLGNAVTTFGQQELKVDPLVAVAMGVVAGAALIGAGTGFVIYVLRLTYLKRVRTSNEEPAVGSGAANEPPG